jgi:hypothetical protein
MRLPRDAVIARTKLTEYLLQWRRENDKSGFLAWLGYTAENADRLADDLRSQLLSLDAELDEATEYGKKYLIVGTLTGPNDRKSSVVSVWMIEAATGATKFITLYPARNI